MSSWVKGKKKNQEPNQKILILNWEAAFLPQRLGKCQDQQKLGVIGRVGSWGMAIRGAVILRERDVSALKCVCLSVYLVKTWGRCWAPGHTGHLRYPTVLSTGLAPSGLYVLVFSPCERGHIKSRSESRNSPRFGHSSFLSAQLKAQTLKGRTEV